MILVVGGTGQLGFAAVRALRDGGTDVTVLARPSTDTTVVEGTGARMIRGDLRAPDGFGAACAGVETIIATANSIVPRRGERADASALIAGYAALGRAARRAGVHRFLFVSVPTEFMGRGAAEFDEKARIEAALRADGPPLTVVRASLFMESWLPAVGSRLALRGSEQATLDRGFWLARLVGATMQRTLDRFGVALLPGDGRAGHAFVAVGDVAGVLAAAAGTPDDLPAEILVGGPETLSWRDVAALHGAVLKRRVRPLRLPVAPLRWASALARRGSPVAANLLATQALLAGVQEHYPAADAQRFLGRPPISVEEFLRTCAARG